jgi:hypothetical protein
LATAVNLLAACKPSEPIGPPGQVTLSYSGASDSEFLFVLENRSAQEILLPVSKSFWSGVKPWGSGLGCLAEDSSYVSSIWPSFDGRERREIVKVSPEGRLQLEVDKGEFSAPRYRGPCHVVLTMQNDTTIQSNNFKP